MEVVMMTLVRFLVAGSLSRDLDAADEALFLQVFQGTVDGRDPQGRDGAERQAVDVVRKKGALLLLQDGLDRLFLACGAALDAQGSTMLPVFSFKPSTMTMTLCLIMES